VQILKKCSIRTVTEEITCHRTRSDLNNHYKLMTSKISYDASHISVNHVKQSATRLRWYQPVTEQVLMKAEKSSLWSVMNTRECCHVTFSECETH